jgi:hypothetical protein
MSGLECKESHVTDCPVPGAARESRIRARYALFASLGRDDAFCYEPDSSMISMPDTVALLTTGSNVKLIFP